MQRSSFLSFDTGRVYRIVQKEDGSGGLREVLRGISGWWLTTILGYDKTRKIKKASDKRSTEDNAEHETIDSKRDGKGGCRLSALPFPRSVVLPSYPISTLASLQLQSNPRPVWLNRSTWLVSISVIPSYRFIMCPGEYDGMTSLKAHGDLFCCTRVSEV